MHVGHGLAPFWALCFHLLFHRFSAALCTPSPLALVPHYAPTCCLGADPTRPALIPPIVTPQLGGPKVMGANGVSHHVVEDDLAGGFNGGIWGGISRGWGILSNAGHSTRNMLYVRDMTDSVRV